MAPTVSTPHQWAYQPTLSTLSEELSAFTSHCCLTGEETLDRELFKDTMELTIKKLWPGAECFLFGSYATGLSVVSSDVDIAVCIDGERPSCQQLWQFSDAVRALDVGFSTSVFADAKVPIVRVYTQASGGQKLHCDVTFVESLDRTKRVVDFQNAFLDEYPMAKPLIVATKVLLKMWSLNTVHSGGLSSTSILLLVRRFLQIMDEEKAMAQARRSNRQSPTNVSTCTSPADLVGLPFDANPTDSDDTATSDEEDELEAGAAYGSDEVSKSDELGYLLLKLWWHAGSPDYEMTGFCLMDPNEEGNDVSAGTHRMFEIQRVLLHSAMSISGTIATAANIQQQQQQQQGGSKKKMNQHQRMLALPPGITLVSSIVTDPRLAAPPPYQPLS